MADVKVAFEGWNSSSHGWGDGTWGNGEAVPSATGAVGAVSVTADANVSVTGVAGTGAVGSVSVSANADVDVSGVSGTGTLGSVTVTGEANVSPTGVAGTGTLGSVTVSADASTSVTGVEGTGTLGSVSVTGTATVSVTGVAGTTGLGSVTTITSNTIELQHQKWSAVLERWNLMAMRMYSQQEWKQPVQRAALMFGDLSMIVRQRIGQVLMTAKHQIGQN